MSDISLDSSLTLNTNLLEVLHQFQHLELLRSNQHYLDSLRHIKSYGVEDEITFLNTVKPAVIRFFSRLTTSVKTRLILHCEMEILIMMLRR